MEGVLYCKPHFQQLFKKSGNFNKNFQSLAKLLAERSPDLKPELTRLPSKVASMFLGIQEKCTTCSKTVYPLEKDERWRPSSNGCIFCCVWLGSLSFDASEAAVIFELEEFGLVNNFSIFPVKSFTLVEYRSGNICVYIQYVSNSSILGWEQEEQSLFGYIIE